MNFHRTTFNPTTEQARLLEHVMSGNFPWFFHGQMLYADEQDHVPFCAHTLRNRSGDEDWGIVNSKLTNPAEQIFYQLSDQAGFEVKKILRSAFNLTWNHPQTYCDVHKDHPFPHYNFLLYLNDAPGANTILFAEDGETIVAESEAKRNDAVFFSGELHAHRFCRPNNRRVVLVVTFLGGRKNVN